MFRSRRGNVRLTACLLILGLLGQTTLLPGQEEAAAEVGYLTPQEREVVAELNLARRFPKAYAEIVREWRRSFKDRFSYVRQGVTFTTKEGLAAVDEAIEFLSLTAPLPLLIPSCGISRAARDHVRDQALNGGVGHRGGDGSDPLARMSRHGSVGLSAGEIIGYGHGQARDIVVLLLVDDDVPGRGHRQSIFTPTFTRVGVAIGPHLRYRWACVIDFAGEFAENDSGTRCPAFPTGGNPTQPPWPVAVAAVRTVRAGVASATSSSRKRVRTARWTCCWAVMKRS